MRHHYKKREDYKITYGQTYSFNHPVYNRCTLYLQNRLGLSVIQQRYNSRVKYTWWSEIDPWLVDDLYLQKGFQEFFEERAGACKDGLYPTVTVRQIMWALRMKPLKKEVWETVFDRREI